MNARARLPQDSAPNPHEDAIPPPLREVPRLPVAPRPVDAGTLEQWVRAHGGRLLEVARRLLRSEHDAREAVRETLRIAAEDVASLHHRGPAYTWLHRILIVVAVTELANRRSGIEPPIEPLPAHYSRTLCARE
jgi:DNA-directed RNA polymerase specialized sigma24 family protein